LASTLFGEFVEWPGMSLPAAEVSTQREDYETGIGSGGRQCGDTLTWAPVSCKVEFIY